jgi:capsid protein
MNRNSKRMPEVPQPAMARLSLVQRMEQLRISEGDRQAAAEWMREGESLADFIRQSADALRSTASFLEHYFAQTSR